MIQKKYYVYAGYYELWISDCKLGKPLTYLGYSKTLENAINKCQRLDDYATICYSKSLKEELIGIFDWCDEEDFGNRFPFYDEQEYKIA